jgi:DNA polymerase-3 subunit epsilon
MRQIVLDTETTGLEPELGHRIIEIGAVEMLDRQLTGRRFHHYINPQRDIDAGAQEVHGITLEDLADKPLFADIAAELLEFCLGAELIIHNAPFDLGFLDYEYRLLNRETPAFSAQVQILDSLVLARELHPGQRNSLDALCKRFEVDNSNRSLHGALLDAEILAEVYLAMTGGQVDLGLSLEPLVEPGEGAVAMVAERPALKVVRASSDEARLHEQRLASIKQESGHCLWLEMP